MKKLVSLLSAFAVILSISMFSACGGSASANSVVGKWQVVDVAMENMTKEQEAMIGMMKGAIVGENMVFEFTADGAAKTSSKSMPATEGKYEYANKVIKLKDEKSGKEESVDVVKLEGDSLHLKMDMQGQKMIMKMKKQ